MGCDDDSRLGSYEAKVSIHAPAWGATHRSRWHIGKVGVSIHAPAWGATHQGEPRGKKTAVSIHAPAWGATEGNDYENAEIKFQSTHPHGVRPAARRESITPSGFNPRTRMGCDPEYPTFKREIICFNPRTRMGCDLWCTLLYGIPKKFQSTHPHGVRRFASLFKSITKCFNPRTRMGCDCRRLAVTCKI